MLQVIISPAKQMRVAADAFAPHGIPPFPHETARLTRALRELQANEGPESLQALWRVSDNLLAKSLATLDAFIPVEDERALDDPMVAARVTPAVFSYVGIQYQSLAPEVLDLNALTWLEGHLRILSGLYGCVRPFDAVEPYRLEMGTKLAVDGASDLYGFWDDRIARAIEQRAAEGEGAAGAPCVVNLASVEYAKAVLPHLAASTSVVTCLFGEELRGGKPVQRATASKIARGSMVRWMAEHDVANADDLTRFDVGYRFAPELSGRTKTETRLVFMRSSSDTFAPEEPNAKSIAAIQEGDAFLAS